jgi:uncharacterized protein YydD (DUF2326 family)
MELIELVVRRADSLVRQVGFKTGLNLILDKPTAQSTHSGNSVGKTTVLRLIDFCLGSDGDDIWQDAEFKSTNQDIYDFLHGETPVFISLTVNDASRGEHKLTRAFAGKKLAAPVLRIDEAIYKNVTAYRNSVKELLFGYSGGKPTLRQLIPKFVRSSPLLMSKTLKFLGEFGSEADYEALHLFLFGFFAVDVLEERPRLATTKKKLSRDWEALNRIRTEGEIEQLLLHLRREIEELEASRQLRGEVPEITTRANSVTAIRAKAAEVAGTLSRYDGEIASLTLTINALQNEFSDIDRHAVEAVYREAQNYIPKLHHDWNDLTDFVQNLRGRKERFLKSQIDGLKAKAEDALKALAGLQVQEKDEIGSLVKSSEFRKALELRSDLQEKLKKLGSLEQDLRDRNDLKGRIATTQKRLDDTKKKIEEEKAALGTRVGVFNKYFSQLSKLLYGEQYLLHFNETSRGSISFQLSAVGSNVGAGKKASQTAAFDLAYVKFLRETNINFPTFVCHDGLEQIHGNQLSALLTEADQLNGQLILATLRDKLPKMPDQFLENNTILELSQDDKLFRV